MKDKKLQIFVSSTYTDLKDERQAAVEAILSSGHIPAGMELFSAGDETQLAVIERWIDESDIYLLILGGRYGSIDKKTGKSYTHLEYEYALKKSKPLFAVVISEEALSNKVKDIGAKALEQESPKELREFRASVLTNLVKFWDDRKDIKIAIHETLADLSYRKELVGWIRGDNSVNSGFLAEEIARLTKENSELRERLNSSGSDGALYSNLTYSELEDMLKNEHVRYGKQDMSLFEFLIELGPALATGVYIGPAESDGNEKLHKYRLVDNYQIGEWFRFTDDGHKFFLKALVKQRENV